MKTIKTIIMFITFIVMWNLILLFVDDKSLAMVSSSLLTIIYGGILLLFEIDTE